MDKEISRSFNLIKEAPLDISTYPYPKTIDEIKAFYINKNKNRIQDKIVKYKIKGYSGFRGKPITNPNLIYRKLPIDWLNLQEWKNILRGTIIKNLDYEKVVKLYDSPDTFFFIDPPYENTSSDFGYAESTEFDFNRLFNVVNNIKGKFLMTLNNSPNIRKIFKKFIIKPIDVLDRWSNINNSDKLQTNRKELIIMNYKLN